MSSVKKLFLIYFFPAITWFLLSTFLLTLPGSSLPKETWLNKIQADKWIHIFMFGLMVFLFCRALSKKIKVSLQNFLYVFAACCLYGIAMEFVQKYWVINRSFDFGDIVSDILGSLLGFWISAKRYIKK